MRKKAILALMLAAALLLSSCALIKKDMDVDNATEIVRVGDTVYTKGEVKTAVDNYLYSMQAQYSQQYGYNIDITSEAVVAEAQKTVTDAMVEEAVINQKCVELGVLPLTEEEEAEAQAEWDEAYDMVRTMIIPEATGTDLASAADATASDAVDEETDSLIRSYIYYYFGMTEEGVRTNYIREKLKKEVTKDVAVTDEEIQADFNAKVESAKTNYATNPTSYGTVVNNGSGTIYYRPAGYRMVKQILIGFKTEDAAVLTELKTRISNENTTINTLTTNLQSDGITDVDAEVAKVTVTLTEQPGATVTDLTATSDASALEGNENAENIRLLAEATARRDGYQAQLDAAREDAFAHIDGTADEVLEKIAAGEDWDTLVAEYNTDPGMKAGARSAATGYAVCEGFTSFDSAFVTGAMALENVGDTSGKIRSTADYGYYILRYESAVEEGPVALEDVREGIASALLTTKQNDFYNAEVDRWVSEADVKVDLNALKD